MSEGEEYLDNEFVAVMEGIKYPIYVIAYNVEMT